MNTLMPIAVFLFSLGVVITLIPLVWIIKPSTDALPAGADAVFVLAGGKGERLKTAKLLMDSGIAPNLIVSTGILSRWDTDAAMAVQDICQKKSANFQVLCKLAQPDKTRGEAATFSELAVERNWQTIIVVTSEYHLFRSMLWFNSCFDGRLYGVPAKKRNECRSNFSRMDRSGRLLSARNAL